MTDTTLDIRRDTQGAQDRGGRRARRRAPRPPRRPPVEGAANDALIEFLAAALRLPRRDIRIVSGERSRRKRVAIAG